MLSAVKLHRTQKIRFADLPSVVDVKKGFVLRDHRVVVPCRAPNRQRSPSLQASRNRAGKLCCADSRSIVETSREACGPMLRPPRHQAHPAIMVGCRKIKEVVVLTKSYFVSWLVSERSEPCPSFDASGVQRQSPLELQTSSGSLAVSFQSTGPRSPQVCAFRIKLHAAVQCPQCVFNFSLSQIYGPKPHPVIRIVPGDLQDFQVFCFRLRQTPGPVENARAPRTHVHVLRSPSDFAVDDSQCRIPVLRFGTFSYLRLPVGMLLL